LGLLSRKRVDTLIFSGGKEPIVYKKEQTATIFKKKLPLLIFITHCKKYRSWDKWEVQMAKESCFQLVL